MAVRRIARRGRFIATDIRVVRALILAGADIHAVTDIGTSVLSMAAAYEGNPEAIQILQELGAS